MSSYAYARLHATVYSYVDYALTMITTNHNKVMKY